MKHLTMTAIAAQFAMVPLSVHAAAPPSHDLEDAAKSAGQDTVFAGQTEAWQVFINQHEAAAGDTVSIWLRSLHQEEDAGDTVYASLRVPDGSERLLRFTYIEEHDAWRADYTITPYDKGGQWQLQAGEGADSVELLAVTNEEQLRDENAPRLTGVVLQDGVTEAHIVSGTDLSIAVQAEDEESGIGSVTVALVHAGHMETVRTLSLRPEQDGVWRAKLTWDEALPAGSYKLVYTVADCAGNAIHDVADVKVTADKEALEKQEMLQEEALPQEADLPEPETPQESAALVEEKAETAPAPETVIQKEQPVKVKAPAAPAKQPAPAAKKAAGPVKAVQKEAAVKEKPQAPVKQAAVKQTAAKKAAESKQPSAATLFAYVAGVFLLGSVLKHNKDWSQEG